MRPLLLLLFLTNRLWFMRCLESFTSGIDVEEEDLCRQSQPVPEEFTAPLELEQQHFGLVDDYGIKPKQPKFRKWTQQKESEKLHKTHKSKRDEPNFEEYYYDDLL